MPPAGGHRRAVAPSLAIGRRAPSTRGRQPPALAAAPPASPPPPPPTTYDDSLTDIAFIAMCRLAYGKLAGWQSDRSWTRGEDTYAGMVDVSRALMRARPTAAAQQEAVISGLPRVPGWFRKAFPASRWGARVNASITPTFFKWLVGPASIVEVDVDDGPPNLSGVRIEKCRYLEQAGCAAMCVNLCQQPVQTFFTDQLGMPLTMEPDFGDGSCVMAFGRRPPAAGDDPARATPCLAACSVAGESAKAATQCPSLRLEDGRGG